MIIGNNKNLKRGLSSKQTHLQQGFTLVELAIVILVLSILLLSVFSISTGIIKISTSTSPSREAKRQTIFAIQTLKSTINQTYYQKNRQRLWFVGRTEGIDGARRDRVSFSAVHSGSEEIGSSSVREVSYYLRDQDDGLYTLIRREDEMVDTEPGKGGAHYEVLHNVESFQLRYLSNQKDWLLEWDTRKLKRLPPQVQIELKIRVGEKTYTFNALASPKINIT